MFLGIPSFYSVSIDWVCQVRYLNHIHVYIYIYIYIYGVCIYTVCVCIYIYIYIYIYKGKISSYIGFAQYPILRIARSALHFTCLADLYNLTPSQLISEASSNMLQLMCKDCSYTYPPLCIARHSFIQQSELEQCRMKKYAQGFNTAAQDSNPGPLSQEHRGRESEALPLSDCALQIRYYIIIYIYIYIII